MPPFISTFLVKQIADHHDVQPNDFKEFEGEDGMVLATKPGGRVSDLRNEDVRLVDRIGRVVDTLSCVGVTEAKLPIGDGTHYVIVCVK